MSLERSESPSAGWVGGFSVLSVGGTAVLALLVAAGGWWLLVLVAVVAAGGYWWLLVAAGTAGTAGGARIEATATGLACPWLREQHRVKQQRLGWAVRVGVVELLLKVLSLALVLDSGQEVAETLQDISAVVAHLANVAFLVLISVARPVAAWVSHAIASWCRFDDVHPMPTAGALAIFLCLPILSARWLVRQPKARAKTYCGHRRVSQKESLSSPYGPLRISIMHWRYLRSPQTGSKELGSNNTSTRYTPGSRLSHRQSGSLGGSASAGLIRRVGIDIFCRR